MEASEADMIARIFLQKWSAVVNRTETDNRRETHKKRRLTKQKRRLTKQTDGMFTSVIESKQTEKERM